MKQTIITYLMLTKPGIVIGNNLSLLAGLFLASQTHISLKTFIAAYFGLAFVMASACVANNMLDRKIDARMHRTRNRGIPSGKVGLMAATIYSTLLLAAGLLILYAYTTKTAFWWSVAGWVFYVIVYGYAKRKSVHGTLIGSISGAVPPVVGYTAVTNHFDTGALLLFLILVFWQMPHFFAIGIYRLKDYKAAGLPILPVKNGIAPTKNQILFYCAGFLAACVALTASGYSSYLFLIALGYVGVRWLMMAYRGLKTSDDESWARGVFKYSLIILCVLCVAVPLDALFHQLIS